MDDLDLRLQGAVVQPGGRVDMCMYGLMVCYVKNWFSSFGSANAAGALFFTTRTILGSGGINANRWR